MKNLLRDFFVPCQENGFRPKVLETQFFFILLGLLIGLKIMTLVSFQGNFGATIFNQVSQSDLYVLTNEARIANGVGKLQISSKLEAAAQLKLADMFQNNYFAHTSPAGIEPWYWFGKANYDYRMAGENLAMNFISSNEVLQAWLNSESHRKNLLLNDFQETGIAVGSGMINGQQTIVVVQEFGRPRTAPVLVVNNIKPVATPRPSPSTTVSGSPAPSPSTKPNLTPKPSLTPKPIIKATPISLKKVVQAIPQVKSAESKKYSWPEYVSYFANDSFKKMMILFSAITVLILLLKVFVSFRIQFPALILKSALLIVISLSFVLIKDEKFTFNKIQIPDKAAIIIPISNAK